MAEMEEVEAPVREDDFLALCFSLGDNTLELIELFDFPRHVRWVACRQLDFNDPEKTQ